MKIIMNKRIRFLKPENQSEIKRSSSYLNVKQISIHFYIDKEFEYRLIVDQYQNQFVLKVMMEF